MLAIGAVCIRNLRNLRAVDMIPGPRLNVLSGDNGQGKTNAIEAIYLAATSRSFRTANLRDVVTRGEADGSVRIDVGGRTQTLALRGGMRSMRLDGKRPASSVGFAAKTPVVAFSPSELALTMGPGKERRKLLDRIAVYTSPAAAEETLRYAHALKCRQRALEARGAKSADLDAWEEIVVRHGLEVMKQRDETARRVVDSARAAFAEIGASEHDLGGAYVPAAPRDPREYASLLRATRDVDARKRAASAGPHRDDLVLTLGGAPARGYASQGQHRAIVLAIKAAELVLVTEARGERPILLLDDVSSELDRTRGAALLAFLDKQEGQVFVTTTRPELIETAARGRTDFAVRDGKITPA